MKKDANKIELNPICVKHAHIFIEGDSDLVLNKMNARNARTLLAAALPATQKQLATLFNSTQPAVSAMRKRHAALLKSDPHYREKWQRITSLKSQV